MAGNTLIMGAAGKDFHVFNTCYREAEGARVACFTATQIPNIHGRSYPHPLSGPRYPQGIPILPEEELESAISRFGVDEVVFCYSDVSYDYVAAREARALRAGAQFRLAPVETMMIRARRPVVAVTAVRTGCGKSQTTRAIAERLVAAGRRVAVVRHPMPYGDLLRQEVQEFRHLDDLARERCTIEEMEEYEPHLRRGHAVYAGVDYGKVLARAEAAAEVILWDGGNNDLPFFRPDLHVAVVDPHRLGHETAYYPGRENFLRAHLIVINKVDSARPEDVEELERRAHEANPRAQVIRARSPIAVSDPARIRGRRVLVVEDGPTLTHGGMRFGAGVLAARTYGAEVVDPRPWVTGTIAETFRAYPDIGPLLPAMGYGERQVRDLEATIRAAQVDAVVVATPIDLARVIRIDKPHVRVTYELEEVRRTGVPSLEEILGGLLGGR
ncbi:MAG: GTPase [Planctomycetes bacterium]|nr:GTPase [Planctomycetota bacterium]